MAAAPRYTLYGFQGSGSAAVEAALHWTGAPFERVDAASWEPGPTLEALGRLNALRQIPTLVIDGREVLTESSAILIHLGLAHPASGLLPQDPSERAQAIRGLVWIAANCYAAIGVIDYPERWCGQTAEQPQGALLRQGARERLHLLWDAFADAFAPDVDDDPRCLLGRAEPCALDLLAVVVSQWSGTRAHLRTSRPAFSRLLARIEAHPRVATVFERHWPPIAP